MLTHPWEHLAWPELHSSMSTGDTHKKKKKNPKVMMANNSIQRSICFTNVQNTSIYFQVILRHSPEHLREDICLVSSVRRVSNLTLLAK